MCSAACKSYATLMVVRFILGLFEAVIFAGMGLIVSMWWTRREQPWRTAVYVHRPACFPPFSPAFAI